MGAYAPLNAWLSRQPANVHHVPTTFEQIERILGAPLPPTARRKSQWWENNATRHVQARAWLDAGFETRDVNLTNETLTFAR